MIEDLILLRYLYCVVLKVQTRFLGGHSKWETPLPIPNREVKPLSADGTALATGWESRMLPRLILKDPYLRVFFVFQITLTSLVKKISLEEVAVEL